MNSVTGCFRGDGEFDASVDALKRHSTVLVTGVCESAYAPFCCSVADQAGAKLLICVSEEKEAYKLAGQLCSFGRNAFVFPARDYVLDNIRAGSREWEQQRLFVLRRVLDGDYDIIISVPDALMQYTMPSGVLIDSTLTLKKGGSAILTELCEKLVSLGYSPCDKVEGKGQFSVRGGILDVFTPNCDSPVRIDFFGDEIDSVTFFDVLDQRSFERCDSVSIVPSSELVIDEKARTRIIKEISSMESEAKEARTVSMLAREKDMVTQNVRFAALDKYFSLIYPVRESLFDYMNDCVRIVIDTKRVADRVKAFSWEFSQNLYRSCSLGEVRFANADLMMSENAVIACLQKPMLALDFFMTSGRVFPFAAQFTVPTKTLPPFGADSAQVTDDINSYIDSGYTVIAAAPTSSAAKTLCDSLTEREIPFTTDASECREGVVYVTSEQDGLTAGFEIPKKRFAVFCGGETLRNRALARKKGFSPAKFKEKIVSYADLNVGDLVVHENHGIGRYDGIKKLTVEGVTKDYIKIQYQGTDVLYVPCNSLDLVSKYIGADGGGAKLSKLGGTDWYKAKQKAKKSAKNIAKDLIAVYSERMKRQGYAFAHDDELQEEFEEHFDYVETYGQLKATEEIKRDMERTAPMDRLLCGDVGFGKTEVALRAVFKCVRDGKQAAILVPTTILAFQHYNTLLSRFRSFPVKCDMLSRFRTKQQQEEILREVKKGSIDVIVGTHRLLQKDVAFKDLGLLVVDEEQRFGVSHKEKLKQLATNVDVLTLTATPIPRTLNMALSGIRDMSVLEEAPQDRVPVQTYVLEYDDVIINEAVKKELRRGGQVFFLHNNIDTIYARASALQEAFPDANIAVGHGKLTREQLSDIWEGIVKGDTDILVCTTIIETGVDVPNANTLIIENADDLGLSQLHQIRGRVGRSARKAYAYLTFRPDKTVSEIAQKRLEAVREFTEFGSGFKIAMRDLELRGAGNLLGAEQHGNIESVGYDMFVRILEEAVSEEKGEFRQAVRDCQMDIAVDAYIPEKYIEASQQRIDIYRKIALLESEEECIDLQTELIDRYGAVPVSVFNLMEISMTRNMACAVGIRKISTEPGGIYFRFEIMDGNVCGILAGKEAMRGKLLLNAGASPYLCYRLAAGEKILPAIEKVLQLYTEISQKQYGQKTDNGI